MERYFWIISSTVAYILTNRIKETGDLSHSLVRVGPVIKDAGFSMLFGNVSTVRTDCFSEIACYIIFYIHIDNSRRTQSCNIQCHLSALYSHGYMLPICLLYVYRKRFTKAGGGGWTAFHSSFVCLPCIISDTHEILTVCRDEAFHHWIPSFNLINASDLSPHLILKPQNPC